MNQDLKDSNKKIQALKAQDTVSQLKAAQESIEVLTIERDETRQKLSLSLMAEQKAKQQLVDERNRSATAGSDELEQFKREADENEELWKEKLMEAQQVNSPTLLISQSRLIFWTYFLQKIAAARKEGFAAGQASIPPSSSTVVPSSEPPIELIQTTVKQIMNQAYRTLSGKLSSEPSYSASEISKILSSTIKVSTLY